MSKLEYSSELTVLLLILIIQNNYQEPMCKRIFYIQLFSILFLFQATITHAQDSWNTPDGYIGMEAYDVTFIDTNKGFAVGEYGKMISTSDGGNTWSFVDSGTEESIFCIQFTSSTVGFAAGLNGLFMHTMDGGATWTIQYTGVPDLVKSIFFISNTEGWIVGNVAILHTQDGGITWITQYNNNDAKFKSVFFINSTMGWAVGDDSSTGQGLIVSTTDGGVNWTPQTSASTQRYNAVFFKNVNDGFIVGWNGALLTTNDGGLNWSNALSGPYSMLNDVCFQSSTDGTIVGNNGRILVTNDGGQSWNEQNFYFSQVDLLSIFFIDSSKGWIAGEGCMLGTPDGGANWSFQYAGTGLPLSGMDFFSPANGLMVGYNGKILRSIDEGATWDLQFTYSNSWLFDVDMVSDLKAWAVGDNGTALSTIDGGVTWTQVPLGIGEELHSVCFTSENDGWIVGNNTILTTNDGGLTWTDQNPGFIFMWDVQFVNANEGWIVGDNGLVLKTINAGANWLVQNLGTQSYFKSVHFISENEGWIVGDGGTICHTTDGGVSWEFQYAGTNQAMNSIYFISPDQGWLISTNKIYVTSNGGDDWFLQYEEIDQYVALSKLYFSPSGDIGFVFGGNLLQYDCTNVPIVLSIFSQPSTDLVCNGTLYISAAGSGGFVSSIDGAPSVAHSGNVSFSNLCPGVHSLSINDLCGHTNIINFIIPIDTNYLENDPFGNSIGIDSISAIIENCYITYSEIDTAFIEDVWSSGDTITVVWNIIDINGPHYDTLEYLLVSGNGIYWLQYSAFCPTKAVGDYFCVAEVVYYANGNVSIVGTTELKEYSFQIFPNPTEDKININFENGNSEINIYDLQGKIIYSSTIESGAEISLRNVEDGLYFISLESNGKKAIKTIIKQ